MSEFPVQPAQESEVDWKGRYERLQAEYAYLQTRVTRFAAVEQDLITARHLIDLERRRFERMREFIRKGVRSESVIQCAGLVCEGIVDILECEIGILWLKPDGGADELLRCSPPDCLPAGVLDELQDWIRRRFEGGTDGGRADEPIPASADFRDYLVQEVVDDDAGRIGLMIAANSSRLADFHDRFTTSSDDAFSAFAGQVGAIHESRKRRETITAQVERIRLSEERLSLALEGSNVGLWDWNLATGRVHYSEQWKRMIGHAGEEISDSFEEWLGRLHPEDRERSLKTASACSTRPGGSFEQTFRLKHRNGSWKWIVARGFTICSENGVPVRVMGTHIDVTAYKRLENRLRRAENNQRLAKEAAERESRAKSSFLANVSHEIRTPLNGILGVYQMLKELPQTDNARELLEMGERSGLWMLDIIGESLDLARIEAGKIELSETPFDLIDLLGGLMEIKRRKAMAKGIHFELEMSPDLPRRVVGDHSKIKQILTNLIGNAIKFTEQGGVRLVVDHRISPKDKRLLIRFKVRDSGVGIPRHSAGEVFKPFYQADQSVTRRFGGVGLGLAIASNLTTALNGSIRLRTPAAGGSEFIVTLPLSPAGDEGQRTEKSTACAPGFTGKVLLAEDDEISRMLAVRMLQNLGLEVATAPDGLSALQSFEPGKFDLVVLDCWMPKVNGIEVSRRIRDQEKAGSLRVPILAMTANVQSSAAIECLEAGMDAFLGKPIRYQALAETLSRLLPQKRTVS